MRKIFPVLILAAAGPICLLEIAFHIRHLPPPEWVGDVLATALAGLGITLLVQSLRQRKTASFAARPSDLPADPDRDWQGSLPFLFHDIRNYSCSLRGNALLLRQRAQSKALLAPLIRLERTAMKIETLAREVLMATSATGAAKTVRLQALELIQSCIHEHFADSSIRFKYQAEASLPALQGDALKLERVFLNLFRNAVEAGARNISIRLTNVPSRLRILVEDDGHGCDRGQLGKLFRPLHTTKLHQGGTGLGLCMVKAIVESHRGRIRVISKNGWNMKETGLIFCLEFPKCERITHVLRRKHEVVSPNTETGNNTPFIPFKYNG